MRLLLHIHSAWFMHGKCGLKVVPDLIQIIDVPKPINQVLDTYSFLSDSE